MGDAANINSPNDFIKKFFDLYMNEGSVWSSLMVSLLQIFVAKLSGHSNQDHSTKVIIFYQMLNVTSPKYFEIISRNLLGVSGRHLRRLNAKETSEVLIQYDYDTIVERCGKYLERR